MLIPAGVIKILNFIDPQNQKFPNPEQNANTMQVQLDNGQVINVKMLSTNPTYSQSLKDFLDFKTSKLLKESEVKKAAYDLVISDIDTYEEELQFIKNNLKTQNPKLTEKQLTQQAAEIVATRIISDKNAIKQTSIIRIPIAISNTISVSEEKSASLPIYYNSKSITVEKNNEGELSFGRSGIYNFAQFNNHIPVEISPIKNKEGVFVGYFKIVTSRLINAIQINSLIDHTLRTLREQYKKGAKPYLLQFLQTEQKSPQDLYGLIAILNGIEKKYRENKTIQKEELTLYANTLKELKQLINEQKYFKYIKTNIPILLDDKFMKKFISEVSKDQGKSPLQTLPQSIVNLNFGIENPSIKNAISNMINQYLSEIATGNIDCKILTTLSFPASDIFNNSESWGFLSNNISNGKAVLSYDDTCRLINSASQLVSHLKESNNETY